MALILGIAVLGGIGSVIRYAIYLATTHTTGTAIVNVTGAFALATLHAAGVTGDAITLLGTGFMGSYTTFSTWMLESTELPLRQAVLNIAIPFAAGVGAVLLPTLV